MKQLKHMFCALLVLIVLGSASVSRAAQETACGVCGANLTWSLTDNGVLTISGTGAMEDYTSGVSPWYELRSAIKTVVIKAGVTRVGTAAFQNCDALTEVTLPDSVVTIGDRAFYYAGALAKINFPSSLSSIGNNAFYGTALTSVKIPETLTIGEHAFQNCSRLTSVSVACEMIPKCAFSYCIALNTITFGATVKHIGEHAFDYSGSLTKVMLPQRLESIGEQAFAGSGLTDIVIPNSVQSVGESAFGSCRSLTTATIGAKEIRDRAFYFCSALTNVAFSDRVETIGDSAFSRTGLTEIELPGSVKNMGTTVFSYCSALTKATVNSEYIGHSAFYNCSALTEVILLNHVRVIGSSAFWRCAALETVTAEHGLEVIADDAFMECTALRSVDIPTSVKLIAMQAFYGCTSLATVNYAGAQQQWQKIMIGSDNDPLWDAVGYAQTAAPELRYGTIPEFMVTDLDGKKITRNTHSGAKVFVFFRPGNADDKALFDELVEKSLPGRYEVTIIAMALDGATAEEVQAFAENYADKDHQILFCTGGDRYIWQFYAAAADSAGYVMRPAAFITNGLNLMDAYLGGYIGVNQIESVLTGTNIDDSETQAAKERSQAYYEAFIAQDPEIFLWNELGIYYYNMSLTANTDEQIAYIRNLTLEITEGCETADEKIWAVAKYLAENTYYDYDYFSDYFSGRKSDTQVEAYAVLTEGYTVCGGFAKTYSVMMQMLEIPCVYVSSCSLPPCHAWNMVHNGERWILLDTTWMCSNGLVDGEKIKGDGVETYWFDVPFEQANADYAHVISGLPYMVYNGVMQRFPACSIATHCDVPEGVTKIEIHAFDVCTDLKSVTLPDSLECIEYEAFNRCYALESIVIPDRVTMIADFAFSECTALKEVTLPKRMDYIGYYAFAYCTALESITIPEGITTLPFCMFKDCTALAEVVIPEGVTTIESGVFQNCTSLREITLPESVTAFGWDVFSGCTALERIVIPNGVTEIGTLAFWSCTSLKEITIPASVTKIDDWAFKNCDALETVYYGGTREQWRKITVGYSNECLTNARIIFADGEEIPGASDVMMGDVNGDGTVNLGDVQLLFMFTRNKAELEETTLAASDVNHDTVVNLGDVQLLFMVTRGKATLD